MERALTLSERSGGWTATNSRTARERGGRGDRSRAASAPCGGAGAGSRPPPSPSSSPRPCSWRWVSPRYTGVAKVLLENQESYFTRPDKATGDRSANRSRGVQSQAETVTTIALARQAVDQARSGRAGRVQQRTPPNPLAFAWSLIGHGRGELAARPRRRRFSRAPDRLPGRQVARAADRVRQRRSGAGGARRQHGRRALLRPAGGREARRARAASAWLSQKIEELRAKVAEADAKVEAFRASPGCSPAPTA